MAPEVPHPCLRETALFCPVVSGYGVRRHLLKERVALNVFEKQQCHGKQPSYPSRKGAWERKGPGLRVPLFVVLSDHGDAGSLLYCRPLPPAD